jgi:nicotinamide riboside kinase
MRIYITGAHCTGKTTLCRWISSEYNLEFIPEVVRDLLKEWDVSFEQLEQNQELMDEYEYESIRRKTKLKNYDNFVSDRTVLDPLAYTSINTNRVREFIDDIDFGENLEQMRADNSEIFLLRPHKELIEDDGVRHKISWESLVEIDGILRYLLEYYEVLYHEIDTTDFDERKQIVRNTVNFSEGNKNE